MKNEFATLNATTPYNIAKWGEGYFSVNAAGHVCVHPNGGQVHAQLSDVLALCQQAGLRTPVLMRFGDILQHRVKELNQAFTVAISAHHYQGAYIPVYPIKVNQQRRVLEEIVAVRETGYPVGLEAGSKPELLAVLAMSGAAGNTIVCNGYKDEEYIRLALLGQRLGYQVYIVVEKLSELRHIIAQAKILNVTPLLGLRVRLMSVSKGNWQNSGGEKSKFGLSATQLVEAVEQCRQAGLLDSVRMLHFHLGSQVANVRDIAAGMQEAVRYYQELHTLGAPIDVLDVGGGLGVDYEGTRSRSYCSMNYTMAEYADCIVAAVKQGAEAASLPHPLIISESGRALTAHHAVLVANIIDQERTFPAVFEPIALATGPQELIALQQQVEQLPNGDLSLSEALDELQYLWQQLHQAYMAGKVSIVERAIAEKAYIKGLAYIRDGLSHKHKHHSIMLDELNSLLADKVFVNFSVFQSVPDVWGIDQIFPILPLSHLHQPLTRRAVIQDITCDSDGRIDSYVEEGGVENTLALPETPVNEIGFFMVGAYQEILGDMHNLFGDTDSVDVHIDANGNIALEHPIQGDTVSSVLQYVNFDPDRLLHTLLKLCQQAELSEQEKKVFLHDIREGLGGYTYLE